MRIPELPQRQCLKGLFQGFGFGDRFFSGCCDKVPWQERCKGERFFVCFSFTVRHGGEDMAAARGGMVAGVEGLVVTLHVHSGNSG